LTGYTETDLPAAVDRNASTNACPTPPTPGGSPVPRAKITSTSGHGSADADSAGVPTNPATAATATPTALLTLKFPPHIATGYPKSRL
jgi:hypothetical protein